MFLRGVAVIFEALQSKIDPAALVEMVKFVNRPGTLEGQISGVTEFATAIRGRFQPAQEQKLVHLFGEVRRRGLPPEAVRVETRGARLIRVSLPIADGWQAHDIALDPPANRPPLEQSILFRVAAELWQKARANAAAIPWKLSRWAAQVGELMTNALFNLFPFTAAVAQLGRTRDWRRFSLEILLDIGLILVPRFVRIILQRGVAWLLRTPQVRAALDKIVGDFAKFAAHPMVVRGLRFVEEVLKKAIPEEVREASGFGRRRRVELGQCVSQCCACHAFASRSVCGSRAMRWANNCQNENSAPFKRAISAQNVALRPLPMVLRSFK